MAVSPKVYILSTLAAVAVTWWFYSSNIRAAEARGYAKAVAEQTAATLAQSEANRLKEMEWQDAWAQEQQKHAQELEHARLIGVTANRNYFRLRESIATEAANAAALAKSAGISVSAGASAWMVLGEVLDRYREVAADADRYTQTIREVQGWASVTKESKK
ncbi:hypothetical protein [Achromobacter xylosoxidans]|uniref:Uncharacterized protein n=1 Tax=Achromobacter phage JWX TaxID=1589746 RepID=A0A0B5A524_9CAUD|nr:hypothetical protein [Achromobacter xylosoxidans]YP_009196219.1 hypothetical protein AVV28_gp34 [Achromobacter phage JWX]AJD82800.1 hypothetical protein JWX_00034 [Achromobacter phage JWX]WLW38453.1 Rz-like spanin [Achromobacter phage JWT]